MAANKYCNLIIFVCCILTQFTCINATKVCYNTSGCDFGWSCNPYSGSCGVFCEAGCEYINTGFARKCINITQSDTKKDVICPTDCSYSTSLNKCIPISKNNVCEYTDNKCPTNCIFNSKTKECVLENLNNTSNQPTSMVCEPYITIGCLMGVYSINLTSIPTYYQNMQRSLNSISTCHNNPCIGGIMYPVRLAKDFNNIKCKYSPGNNQGFCNTYSQVCCNMT